MCKAYGDDPFSENKFIVLKICLYIKFIRSPGVSFVLIAETSLYLHSSVAPLYPKLTFQYISAMMNDGKNNKLFVSGFQVQTNALYQFSSDQKVRVFSIYFQSNAICLLFNIPAHEIRNENIEISDFLEKEGTFVEEQILNCKSKQERVDVINRFV